MTSEEKWFRRLARCIKDMPDTVELAVINRDIVMLPEGAVNRAFEKRGDVDHYNEESMGSVQHPRIITCSECL